MTNSEAWTVPFGNDTDDTTTKRADRALLVIPCEGGIVRGYVDDVVAADQYARTRRGVVARLTVVGDYRDDGDAA